MKKFYLSFAIAAFAAAWFVIGPEASAQIETDTSAEAAMVSPNIVISQIYGGGGSSGAPFTHDFVELFNRGNTAVSLNGWSTQYASAGGTEFLVTPLSNVLLQPGQYYLIQYASNGSVGAALPTPDRIAPLVTNNAGSTFIPNLSGTSGKLALVNSIVRLPASTCPADPTIVDLIGYGDSASCFEGVKTANLSVATAAKRNGGGCTDSDNNNSDFTIGSPAPRNTSSPTNSCNLGSNLQAGINANPNFLSPGASTLITVAVIPAATPASTGIAVVGNLTDIGGAAVQTFFDNGTNGDVTPGDNVFSFLATIPAGMGGGIRHISAVASDAQGRTVNLNQDITINGCPVDDQPLALGNPSNATTDVLNESNYLMTKALGGYSLSYNRSRAISNWVAWRLDSGWLGDAPRQDDFRPDMSLPAGWYQVLDNDYVGSGFDRGHSIPSGDRTCSVPDNSATFLMTNMMPQAAANNQGPWEELETYCRTLVSQGNELYIVDGGAGQGGTGVNGFANTIAGGRVVVPAFTWKVILVLPNGNDDVNRVAKTTRTIAVIMPNHQSIGINTPWRNFRTSVKAVEALTGFNFFANVRPQVRNLIKQKRDFQ